MNKINSNNGGLEYIPGVNKMSIDVFDTKYNNLSRDLFFDKSDNSKILFDTTGNYIVIGIVYQGYLLLSESINEMILFKLNNSTSNNRIRVINKFLNGKNQDKSIDFLQMNQDLHTKIQIDNILNQKK